MMVGRTSPTTLAGADLQIGIKVLTLLILPARIFGGNRAPPETAIPPLLIAHLSWHATEAYPGHSAVLFYREPPYRSHYCGTRE